MSDSVWVVERGEYSYYHVVGVYSSQENAQSVASRLGGRDKPTVVEWTLNPGIEHVHVGREPWWITMLPDGELSSCVEGDWGWELVTHLDVGGWRNNVTGIVWAKDREHAIKIVNERRIAALASGELKP